MIATNEILNSLSLVACDLEKLVENIRIQNSVAEASSDNIVHVVTDERNDQKLK